MSNMKQRMREEVIHYCTDSVAKKRHRKFEQDHNVQKMTNEEYQLYIKLNGICREGDLVVTIRDFVKELETQGYHITKMPNK